MKKLFLAIAIIVVGASCAWGAGDKSANKPGERFQEFYQPSEARECTYAIESSPGYSLERHQSIRSAKVDKIKLILSRNEPVPQDTATDTADAEEPLESGKQPAQSSAGIRQVVDEFTFGSEAILRGLWTDQQLQGTPDEKKIVSAKNDSAPPERQVPKVKNQPTAQCMMNSIRSVKPSSGKPVALTFDLCERGGEKAGYDAEIVNYLRDHSIKATFFAGGKWMRSHPEKTMQLMADPLFEVGNHTWSHANLRIASPEETVNQILWTQAQYELLWEELERKCKECGLDSEMVHVPKSLMVFRFPFGTCNPFSLKVLGELGLPAIQWNVVTGDPAPSQTAETITRTVLSQTRAGSIIICHANGRGHGTAEAVRRFIPELIDKGFEFVTVSELLRLGEAKTSQECYELRPGDNQRYDKYR